MAASVRLLTFNIENLFARFRFREREEAELVSLFDARGDDRANLVRTHWNMLHDEIRTFTALTILEADADVVCLQEVENVEALKTFHDRYLQRIGGRSWRRYPHQFLIEGNDRRGINVAVLSRLPIDRLSSHRHVDAEVLGAEGPYRERVFRRDCLELHVDCGEGWLLPVFVVHLKSMDGGREATRAWREREARTIRSIIERRFSDPAAADWIIAGDLNDYTEVDGIPDAGHALAPLVDGGFAVDLVKRIADPRDRWTHFYPDDRRYTQIDYLLVSPALAARNPQAVPTIMRQGQPFRADRYAGPRWPRVGFDRPKASDHCAVLVTLAGP